IREGGFHDENSRNLFDSLNDVDEAYAILYQRKCIACAGRVLAAFYDSRGDVSRALWNSDEYKYVFFIDRKGACCNIDEQCNLIDEQCADPERRRKSKYYVEPLFNILLAGRGGGGQRRVILRRALIRKLQGPEADALLDELRRSGCIGNSEVEAENHRRPRICDALRSLIGDDTINYIKSLLDLKGAVLLYGPPGMGKTALAECIARDMNAEIVYVTGHQWLTRHTIIGGYTIEGGSVKWKDGIVLMHSNSNNRVVIILDEINRAEPEVALAELFTALAQPRRGRRLYVPERVDGEINIENIYFIATANPVDAVALGRIGVALQRRFPLVELSPSRIDEEKLVDAISGILGVSRDRNEVSIAVSVWGRVRGIFKDRGHAELAPGWSYALDMADLLLRGFTCEEAFTSIYSWYLRMTIPDEEIDTSRICSQPSPTAGGGASI
ncbi:MAG: AAA family ATPase, partial [Desulfurococcales archaeon]|nr:AAA family ATPase [Desulfurococcales archaeon]